MSSSHLAHVLRELNWNANFMLPVSSTENQALECEIKKKEEELEKTQKCLAENEERISILLEHHKDVEQEFHHTAHLLQARRKELETEKHMTVLAKQLKDRCQREIVKLDREIENCKDRSNLTKNTVFHRKEKLNVVTARLNWDSEALEAWLVECKQREDDVILIQKFSSQDDDKIKEFDIKIKKMSEELFHLQNSLDQEKIETMSMEMELDKTAEVFRQMHADRSLLISRWEKMLGQMLAKDRHIQLIAMKFFSASEEVRERKRLLKQKDGLYHMLVEDNDNIRKRTSAAAKHAASMKLDLQIQEQLRNEFQAELKALEMTVIGTSGKLNLARSETVTLGTTVDQKLLELETMVKKCDKLRQKLTVVKGSAVSADEELKQRNELLVEESVYKDTAFQELEELRARLRQADNEMQQKLMEVTRLTMEIGKVSALLKKLNSRLEVLSSVNLQQQDILLKKEILWMELSWRLDRMKGELSDQSEKVTLQTKIRHLTKEIKLHIDTRQVLEKQQRQQQMEFHNIQKAMKQFSSEKLTIISELEGMDLHFRHAGRELEKLTSARQDLLVDLNLLKVKAQRQRHTLLRTASGVELLESDRLAIEASVKERLVDISAQQAELRKSIHWVDQERQKIVFNLNMKLAEIERMKYRYELSMISMAPKNDDHDDDRMNYFIKKTILEKEELLREGDCLDARIRKAEKELEALKNTVTILNYQNSATRQSLRPVSKHGDTMQVKEQLEKEFRELAVKLKQKQKQVRDIKADYQVNSQAAADLHREEETLAATVEEKKMEFCQVKKNVDCCKARLHKADQLNVRLAREIRAGAKIIQKMPEEVDIDIRVLRELNKNAIQKMNEVIKVNPEMAAAVREKFLEASIPLSCQSTSSSSSSSTSSTRSCRQVRPTSSEVKKSASLTGRSSSS